MKRALLMREGKRRGSEVAPERALETPPDYRRSTATNKVEPGEREYGWTNPDTKRPHRIDNPDTDPETVYPQN